MVGIIPIVIMLYITDLHITLPPQGSHILKVLPPRLLILLPLERFNNGLMLQWGIKGTDTDGIARINLPLTFANNRYIVAAIHSGNDVAACSINHNYKTVSFLPLVLMNVAYHVGGANWEVEWWTLGY